MLEPEQVAMEVNAKLVELIHVIGERGAARVVAVAAINVGAETLAQVERPERAARVLRGCAERLLNPHDDDTL